MPAMRTLIVLMAMSLLACGVARPCSVETTTCGCYARAECSVVVDTCFCPSECGADVRCVCGGGKFVRCEETSSR